MAKTFCGKNCDECTYKEELDCPGCEKGPGNPWNGDCKIVNCCVNKGHKSCETCSMNEPCGTRSRKHIIPQERIKDLEAEASKQERIRKKASVLGKWLPILFWTSIVSVIIGLFDSDSIQQSSLKVYLIASIAESICGFISVFIFFKISSTSKRYKTAAWATLIATIGVLVTLVLFLFTLELTLVLVVSALSIVSLYAKYSEYKGHSDVLEEVDPDLSEKWDKLIKWYIICNIALIASVILALIPKLAVLVILVASIGMIIVGIFELVFLYHTAKVFKSVSQQ
ncbi:MAG: DUF3795 domain-containing protein [Clostridia bacterium]|nr:DUF3795 domain-containing protein [Clostridia bacterium]